jgi:hypothetical protein
MAGVVIAVGAAGWLSSFSAHTAGEPTANMAHARAVPETSVVSLNCYDSFFGRSNACCHEEPSPSMGEGWVGVVAPQYNCSNEGI